MPRTYSKEDYEVLKERSRRRNAEISKIGRDIAPLPDIVDEERRNRCETDFGAFCKEYFPSTFPLPWSPDHLVVISKIEACILHGELFAIAMARGSGKTSLCEVAAIWALVYAHRKFVYLIGSDAKAAVDLLDSIRIELENNDEMLGDFPEVVYPIQCLEGIIRRAEGQTYEGDRTNITWTRQEVVLPTVLGYRTSGSVIRTQGITGRIRGAKYKKSDGESIRPDLVIVDDPQTDESAKSSIQVDDRLKLLRGAILNLAGPGKKIAGIMPCTVIQAGDVADQILDIKENPEWHGERLQMMKSMPEDEEHWERYNEIRTECLQLGQPIKDATEYYLENQEVMNRGAEASWPERFNEDEASAIQHAMNLKFRDEYAFWAEMQNAPLSDEDAETKLQSPDEIAAKVSKLKHLQPHDSVTTVTGFIDVQGACLYYTVIGFTDDFTGYILDYGTYPKQKRRMFKLRDVTQTLAKQYPGMSFEELIFSGLRDATDLLCGRSYKRPDGSELSIDRMMIDGNWGKSTDVVYEFCRVTNWPVHVSHGRAFAASGGSIMDMQKKTGEKAGLNWRIRKNKTRPVRHILWDTNWWKTFTHERWRTAPGGKGCLYLYGSKPIPHRNFAQQQVAEYPVRVESKYRVVEEWKERPDHPDNHWFDCVVGSMVCASIEGAKIKSTGRGAAHRERRVVSLPKRR